MPKNDVKNIEFIEYDVVLLEWEITGTGRCVGSYSYFNSMIRDQGGLNKATMIEPDISWSKLFHRACR